MANRKLSKAIKKFSNQKQEVITPIQGILGLALNGSKQVEVANRKGFVYVRLRDNTSEVIQAYNSEVSTIYGLAVLVVRQNNIYKVLGRDQDRYQDWGNIPYLPKHGGQHSFNQGLGMGADITWVYTQQFMPLLGYPSGTQGSNGIIISPYTIRDLNGNWKYVGNTGTPDITIYRPSTGTQAVMVLVYIDSVSGNPYLLVGSGSYFSATLTGSGDIAPYIPPVTNPNWIPDTAVRLTSGTTQIFWGNMYDVRPLLQPIPTGSGGGSSGINTGTLDARYLKLDASNDPLTGGLSIKPANVLDFGLDIQRFNPSAESIFGLQSITGTTISAIPVMAFTRQSGDFSNNLITGPFIRLTQDRGSGTISGPILSVTSNATERIYLSVTAQGTGTLVYFDGDYTLDPNGLLLLLKNNGTSRFYVNASGTAHSNGVPLIKEAPTDGNQYARKNAGWEQVTSSGGGGSGTFLVTEDLTSQINGTNIDFLLSNYPDPITSTRLYYNGVRQRYLFNYTVSGAYVQTLYTPTTGSVLTVDYTESSSTGTVNGLIQIKDEGAVQGNVNTLNFVGANVQATVAGSVATIVVTGSSSSYGELIATASPSGTSSVSFTSIPAIYTSLIVEYTIRSTTASDFSYLQVQFNGDTTATNYRYVMGYTYAAGTVAGEGGDDNKIGAVAAANSPTSSPGNGNIDIKFYANTDFKKQAIGDGGVRRDATSVHEFRFYSSVEWESTAAINRVDVLLTSGNYVFGSKIKLYGIF